MLVKIAITGAVALIGFATALYAVNKTADRMEEENELLPEEDQLSSEELGDNLMGEFIQDVKEHKVTSFITLVGTDAVSYARQAYDFRIKIALVVLAAGVFPFAGIPLAAKGVAFSVLGQELVFQAFTHACTTWGV